MKRALFIPLLALAFWAPTVRGQDLPPPARYVEDHANIIDEQHEHALNGYLQELEQKTTCQIIALTVETTGGVPIGDYAFKLAEKWKLGQEDKDNGALIVVAVKDRKYWITVGYGLEGPLPDSLLGTVGRQYFVPNFRAGNYGKGLFEGTVAIINRLEQEYGVEISGMPEIVAKGGPAPVGLVSGLITLFFFILLFRVFGIWGLVLFPFLGRYPGGAWGGSGSFGGGSSGGFGSFGGGGGGSFGGGGAGGGW